MIDRAGNALARALALTDAVGAELAASPFQHQTQTRALERIPVPDEAEAARRTGLAESWLREVGMIDRALLPPRIALQVAVVEVTARRLASEAGWYWHVHDPLGLGFFGMFGPTAYCGGWYLGTLAKLLAQHRFERAGDGERYFGLVADVVAVVRSMETRLAGQRARGIAMPQAQVAQATALARALRLQIATALRPAAERLRALPSAAALTARIDAMIEDELLPAFGSLSEYVEGTVAASAVPTVGLAQYSGGADIYAALVRQHTTLDLSPEQVHATGHARVARIEADMRALLAAEGFRGTADEYRRAIATHETCRALTSADVEARFARVLADVQSRMASWFHTQPAAPYGVAPLPEAVAASMTFGFYQVPTSASDRCVYNFNAPNMIAAGLATVPTLACHELIPGHHLHLAGQAEDRTLPPLLRHNSFNAFAEGWAEYAATLCGEHDIYRNAQERFGRLSMDTFLSCRLVVDTSLVIPS